MKEIRVKNISIGKGHPLTIISGPCVIENENMTLQTAERLNVGTLKYELITV